MAHSAETLYNGTKVFISENHRFGTDAMLLSAPFVFVYMLFVM